mmetsp:Transcript_9001/g.23573  ORF Transcript_9001/g.23573 Transcript_9001/m.23573 type:complete len:557 (-) Transcript_9001:772-2442(-)
MRADPTSSHKEEDSALHRARDARPDLALVRNAPLVIAGTLVVRRNGAPTLFLRGSAPARTLWAELRGGVLLGYASQRQRDDLVFVENVSCASISRVAKDDAKLKVSTIDCKSRSRAKAMTLEFETASQAEVWRVLLEGAATDCVAKLSDYEIVSPLGIGGAGRVFLARKIATDKYHALKVVSKYDAMQSAKALQLAVDERLVLERVVGQPFVMNLSSAFQTNKNLYLVLEFCPGGDLERYLRRCAAGRMGEREARIMLAEVLLALCSLHKNGIVHRDIKPENIMISAGGHVCVGDFGLSKVLDPLACLERESGFELDVAACADAKKQRQQGLELEKFSRCRSFCGSQEYVSPQIVRDECYGFGVDVWAFGVLMFRVLTGSTPFYRKGLTRGELFRRIELEEPQPPSFLSEAAQDLLKLLLAKDEGSRPTFDAVRGHAWFHEIDWEAVARKEHRWHDANLPRDLTASNLARFDAQRLQGLELQDDELKASAWWLSSRRRSSSSARKYVPRSPMVAGYSFGSASSLSISLDPQCSDKPDRCGRRARARSSVQTPKVAT